MSDRAYIIGELERLVAELKRNPQTPSNAAGGGASAPAGGGGNPLGAWQRARVTFWTVEEKLGPKGPYCRASLYVAWRENGEDRKAKMSTLDRKLIESVDPLQKGDMIEYQSQKRGEYEDVTAIRVTR